MWRKFPKSFMSVNNVYNCDAHSWPKNTILIAWESKINGTNKKRFSNFKSIITRCFSGNTIDTMYFNLTPLLVNLAPLLRKRTSRFSFRYGYQQFGKRNIISDFR